MDDTDRLRAYVGERIPSGGADTDTMFTIDEINDLLTGFQGSASGTPAGLYLAAAEGWERKASTYADMADHEQGGAKDNMSQLAASARVQADRYRSLGEGRRQASINAITRAGTTTI